MKQLWDRWAPLTGVLSVVCSFVGVMFALDQPQDKDSGAKIVAYFAQHSHRMKGVVGFFVFLAGLVLLVAFLGALRERLVEADGGSGRWSALVFGAGIASVPLWARQMEIFILEDMNELEAARILLGGLLESGAIHDPAEARFLQQRLEELERRLAARPGR